MPLTLYSPKGTPFLFCPVWILPRAEFDRFRRLSENNAFYADDVLTRTRARNEQRYGSSALLALVVGRIIDTPDRVAAGKESSLLFLVPNLVTGPLILPRSLFRYTTVPTDTVWKAHTMRSSCSVHRVVNKYKCLRMPARIPVVGPSARARLEECYNSAITDARRPIYREDRRPIAETATETPSPQPLPVPEPEEPRSNTPCPPVTSELLDQSLISASAGQPRYRTCSQFNDIETETSWSSY